MRHARPTADAGTPVASRACHHLRHELRLGRVDDAVSLASSRGGRERVGVEEEHGCRRRDDEATASTRVRALMGRGDGRGRPSPAAALGEAVERKEASSKWSDLSASSGGCRGARAGGTRVPHFEAPVVDKRVGDGHDVLAHAVLVLEVDDRVRVRVGQELKGDTSRPPRRASSFCTRGGSWLWSPTSTKVRARRIGPRQMGSVICEASSTMQ